MSVFLVFVMVLAALFIWGGIVLFVTEGLRYFCEVCEEDEDDY